ncbi:MAG: hypothetical protein WCH84_11640, partial [Verrucomicrobiota bacterium]
MKVRFFLTIAAISLSACNRAPVPLPAPAASVAPPVAVAPVPPPAPPVDDRLPEALKLKDAGKPLEARSLLQELVAATNANDQALAALGEINGQIILTALPAAEKVDYTIQA